jgi:hypothetical protein
MLSRFSLESDRSDVTRVDPEVQIQRSEATVQREGFESTVKICHSVLESRHFEVARGGLRVVLIPDDLDTSVPNCRDFTFGVTLTRSEDWWPDDEIGNCEASTGGARSFSFANLTAGRYYLTIWRSFDNPYCCLSGDLLVFDEPVATDSMGCRRDKDPSAMDVIHGALDIAGFVPVLGAIPDGVNAGIYALEGDWINAGLSAVATVPAWGDGVKLGSIGAKSAIKVSEKAAIRLGEEGVAKGLKEVKAASKVETKAATESAERTSKGGITRNGLTGPSQSSSRIDPAIDEAVERGIIEEATTSKAATRPKPGAPLVRGNADAARKTFDGLRDGYARRLGVTDGGQVHHAIELQALDRYPGAFTPAELNEFANMRGIATELANRRQLHNSKIREVWDRHYRSLDKEIVERSLQPGTDAYNTYARRYLESGREEIDHVLGQFFTEYRSGLTWSGSP